LVDAVKKFFGTRIMQQEPFECLISYILSINSNIPRIKKNVEDLCKKYGKEVKINSYTINLFPSFERLKDVSLEELEKLRFGFRAKFIKQTISLLPKLDEKNNEQVLFEKRSNHKRNKRICKKLFLGNMLVMLSFTYFCMQEK
jgi:endonuclease III